ncbi:MAG: prolipoprotein diacylglyceryl transferase [Prevotellaceae bacterium]|jgi:prolipoprotein diacylglyceryl transferase|nr:prolipoprotein diacylglyceryl transferase [Prevotellaceae bacterium]
MLNYITWNVSPEIFSFGPVHLRWYGLLWALAILSAFWVVTKIFKYEKRPENWSDKMFLYGAISLIIGARLGHCLFYGADGDFFYFYKHPFEMLKIWEGGLASHGGAIGLLIGMWFYTKHVTHKSYLYVMDRLVIGVAIGGALIRLGNLMNSEIYGGTTTLPWGFIFVRDGQTEPKHPTQIYEILYCLMTFAITWIMYWKAKVYRRKGLIFGVFLICIFGIRFLLEFIKNLQEPFEANMPLNMGQLLSLPLIIWGIFLIIKALKNPAKLEDFEKNIS